jgi:integrase
MAESEETVSVFKRRGSPYYQFDFLFKGRRCRGSTKLTNRIAAGRYENNLREKLAKTRAGILDPEPAPVLREYRERFLEAIRAVGRKPRTVAFYRTCLGNLEPTFGAKRLDEISPEAIRAYAEGRRLDGRAGRTVNCDLATLRRVMSVAVKEGLLPQNPFASRRVEFCREGKMERVVTYTEEKKYLAAGAPFLRDAAIIMLEMGLRPSELLRIHSRDVSLWDSPLTLRIPDSKTPSGRREVPISRRALAVIRARVEQANGGYLFPFRTQDNRLDWNRPTVELRKAHARALRAAGIHPGFRIYDLRHTYGTRAAEAETDPLTLQRLMGHASLATTGRYVHLSKRHLAEAQRRIEEYRRVREIAEAEAQVNAVSTTQ